MEVCKVDMNNIELFSNVLIDSARLLDKENQTMWKIEDLSVKKLLEKYDIEDMKLCYEDGQIIGVFILQWYDPLFWPEVPINHSGIIHKLAVSIKFRKQRYGEEIIKLAEAMCKEKNIKSLRLNCGTSRKGLRNFYEKAGFKKQDRVFIDDRDQVKYVKELLL